MQRRRRSRRSSNDTAAVAGALAAISAEELRELVVQALDSLDDEPRGHVEDALLRHAARGAARWRPAPPPGGVIGDVRRFLTAARHTGSADPAQVDDYLRDGIKASMAGDSAAAAALFGELLPAIGDGNIDLGQHELVDEVLSVDLGECAARYLHAVYVSVDSREQPSALLAAIDRVDAVARVWEPIEKMERVAHGSLPDLEAFLPAWVEKLRSVKPTASDWEDAHDRRLREAITRAEGLPGPPGWLEHRGGPRSSARGVSRCGRRAIGRKPSAPTRKPPSSSRRPYGAPTSWTAPRSPPSGSAAKT